MSADIKGASPWLVSKSFGALTTTLHIAHSTFDKLWAFIELFTAP